jgi:hypothetical protein
LVSAKFWKKYNNLKQKKRRLAKRFKDKNKVLTDGIKLGMNLSRQEESWIIWDYGIN